MNIAFIEHTQNDVNHDDGDGDEVGLAGERSPKRLCIALERADQRGRHGNSCLGSLDRFDRLSQCDSGRQIER